MSTSRQAASEEDDPAAVVGAAKGRLVRPAFALTCASPAYAYVLVGMSVARTYLLFVRFHKKANHDMSKMGCTMSMQSLCFGPGCSHSLAVCDSNSASLAHQRPAGRSLSQSASNWLLPW